MAMLGHPVHFVLRDDSIYENRLKRVRMVLDDHGLLPAIKYNTLLAMVDHFENLDSDPGLLASANRTRDKRAHVLGDPHNERAEPTAALSGQSAASLRVGAEPTAAPPKPFVAPTQLDLEVPTEEETKKALIAANREKALERRSAMQEAKKQKREQEVFESMQWQP